LHADNTIAVSGKGSENMLHNGKNTAAVLLNIDFAGRPETVSFGVEGS
jgi:hypothetical protein